MTAYLPAEPPAEPRPQAEPRGSSSPLARAASIVDVLRDTALLLWRRWPTLAAIAVGGLAVREVALLLAVQASKLSGTLGLFVIAIAPLAVSIALVAMLLTLRSDLPALTQTERTAGLGRIVDELSAALLPILAIYASVGLLKDDTRRYITAVVADLQSAGWSASTLDAANFDWARIDPYQSVNPILLVGAAMLARKYVAKLAEKHTPVKLAVGYLQVLWLAVFANYIGQLNASFDSWWANTRLVHTAGDLWAGFVNWFGVVGDAVTAVITWWQGVWGVAGEVILVPFAWLTTGAVVYGYQKVTTAFTPPKVPNWVPKLLVPVVKYGRDSVIDSVRSPIEGLRHSWRMLASLGVGRTVVLALMFVVLGRIEPLHASVVRAIRGPVGADAYWLWEPTITSLRRAVGFVVVIAAVAASVNLILKLIETRDGNYPFVKSK